MSTTFEVTPTKKVDLTFGEVLELAERTAEEFLREVRVDLGIKFNVDIIGESSRIAVSRDMPFEWSSKDYAWFSVEGFYGGTDAYCELIFEPELEGVELNEFLLEEMRWSRSFKPEYEELIEKAKLVDRVWTFRRSVGQPTIINLCYGYLAAAVAELSDGFIFMGDCAWRGDIFPCFADEFRKNYFFPDKAGTTDEAEHIRYRISVIDSDERA